MTTAGPNFGTGSDAAYGSVSWTDPGNISADDTSYAYAAPATTTHYLVCDHLGFAVPEGATITDVSFSYKRQALDSNEIKEYRLVLADGGNNVADTNTYWSESQKIITKHGGNSYWGVTLTPAMVNSTAFGLKIVAYSLFSGYIARIYYVTCTVTYTLPPTNGSRAQIIGSMW